MSPSRPDLSDNPFALRWTSLLLVLAWTVWGGWSSPLPAQSRPRIYHIQEIIFEGLNRTDIEWLYSYIPINCPCDLNDFQIEGIRSKLLTTQVFQSVEVQHVTLIPEGEKLIFFVEEKWTIIPVIRGAVGGGTPLLVAGIYDSHLYGRLITAGAETRTYGDAPTGGVAWIRAPRWREGHHYLNLEVWRDNRIRTVFDRKDKDAGSFYSSALAVVGDFLAPVGSQASPWQLGLRIHFRKQERLRWDNSPTHNPPVQKIDFRTDKSLRPQLKLIYDDLSVSQINMSGWRAILGAGPTLGTKNPHGTLEQEFFWYGLWDDWNLGFHEWLGFSDDQAYQALYFLGGFDSVRGIPDGVIFGNKAFYTNLELRKILYRAYYSWIQAAAYVDYGAAAYETSEWDERDRASVGIGIRIAIPQVHRLMLRVDYAWSVDRPGTSSISAGLNQFFDPYRPL